MLGRGRSCVPVPCPLVHHHQHCVLHACSSVHVDSHRLDAPPAPVHCPANVHALCACSRADVGARSTALAHMTELVERRSSSSCQQGACVASRDGFMLWWVTRSAGPHAAASRAGRSDDAWPTCTMCSVRLVEVSPSPKGAALAVHQPHACSERLVPPDAPAEYPLCGTDRTAHHITHLAQAPLNVSKREALGAQCNDVCKVVRACHDSLAFHWHKNAC
jgi:hypothetical protein